MVLKGVNWVHNVKIRSYGLERSQLGAQYKYRGYLLRQVVFCFTDKSMDFSVWCCPLEGWVGNVVFAVFDLKSAQKPVFELIPWFWPKTMVSNQKLQFLTKNHSFWLIWDTSQWAYAIMIHESKNAWRLCTLLLARVLIF